MNGSARLIFLPIGQVMMHATYSPNAVHPGKYVVVLVLFVAFVIASGVMYSRGGLQLLLAGYAAIGSLISLIAATVLVTINGYAGAGFVIIGLMAIGVFGLLGAARIVGPPAGRGDMGTEIQPPKR